MENQDRYVYNGGYKHEIIIERYWNICMYTTDLLRFIYFIDR